MRVLLMLVCGMWAGVLAMPSLYHGYVPATYSAYYPYSLSSQYHAQDELGQYSYGYSGGPSAKHETKTLDGVTRGGYSYVDANGVVQTVNYVADDVYGFRVAATNLPQAPAPVVAAAPVVVAASLPVTDTPEVARVKAEHLAALQKAAAEAAPLPVAETPEVAQAKADHLAAVEKAAAEAAAAPDTDNTEVVAAAPLAPIVSAAPVLAAAPVYAAAPVLTAAHLAPVTSTYYSAPLGGVAYAYGAGYPLAVGRYSYLPVTAATSYSVLSPLSSQYHAQDELGQYSYGYSGGPSAKRETKTLDGVTRGGYSYVDANGVVQTINYVADDEQGFRVAGTNLPVAPAAN